MARAFAAVADSDPVKDAGADRLAEYPNQAWYAARSAALALAGYGGTAAGLLIGKPPIFPTKFALPQFHAPRAYAESDLDAVTLFGYAEAEVQQGLMAQLERYEQTEEREGAEAAERQREIDYAEAVANLEVAIFSARNHMRKADARADREARFERAQPRIARPSLRRSSSAHRSPRWSGRAPRGAAPAAPAPAPAGTSRRLGTSRSRRARRLTARRMSRRRWR